MYHSFKYPPPITVPFKANLQHTHLLLIPDTTLVIHIVLVHLLRLLPRIRFYNQYAPIALHALAFLERFVKGRATEHDRAIRDEGSDAVEMLTTGDGNI